MEIFLGFYDTDEIISLPEVKKVKPEVSGGIIKSLYNKVDSLDILLENLKLIVRKLEELK